MGTFDSDTPLGVELMTSYVNAGFGSPCNAESMVLSIEKAASQLKHPLISPDGSERVSGHSLRVTGAQGMAKLGLDVWAIQLLGRWGSNAVLQYVRMAHLESATSWAKRAASRMSLDEVVKDLVKSPEAAPQLMPQPLFQSTGCQTDVAEALAHEVQVEAAKGAEKLTVVMSDTGIAHSVLLGPPEVDLHSAKTICGWKFGRSGASLRRSSDLPQSHKALCQRCFPGLRESLKEELSRSARSLGEGSSEPGPAAGA